MTISSQVGRVQYNGNGVTVLFTVNFKFFANGDLTVIRQSSAGVDTLLVLNVDYTVAGAGIEAGGSITTTVAPANGEKLTIILDPDLLQQTDYVENDPFPAESHERGLDRVTQFSIRSRDISERTIRLTDGDIITLSPLPGTAARQGKFLAFDANSQPIGSVGTGNDAALRTDLAVTTVGNDGARLSGYRRTETGSVARSVFQKLEEAVSVLDFGADRTGVADSSAAFNNAIAAAIALGHGEVEIPSGMYRANLDITASGIHLRGPSRSYESSTVGLYPFNNADYVIDVGAAAAYTRNFGLSNINVHGHGGGDLGVRLRNVIHADIDRCSIRAFDVYGLHITSAVGFGTAFININKTAIAGNGTGGSIACRIEDNAGYATAVEFSDSDLHSTAGGSFALDLQRTSGPIQICLSNIWIECGNNRGVNINGASSVDILCAGVNIDSPSSADVLVNLSANARVADFFKGLVFIDGLVAMPAGNTAALTGRAHFPTESLYLFPHVQGSMSFQDSSAALNAQHAAGSQNQRLSRTGTNLNITSSDGSAAVAHGSAGGLVIAVSGGGAGRIFFDSTAGVSIRVGTGSPEGIVTAPVSSHFHRTDGGAVTSTYFKETGAGNTGWVAK